MGCAAAGAAGGAAVSAIACSWCGNPASRMYPGRIVRRTDKFDNPVTDQVADFYACSACDALVRAGKPLPAGVATFSVAVREDGE
jgi:hypothetical protein